MEALMAFLFDKKDLRNKKALHVDDSAKKIRFVHDGWNLLNDQAGYPGVKPPWGTLNAVDLNSGEILWKVPLGEYPELIAKGLASDRNSKPWRTCCDGRRINFYRRYP